MARHGTSQAALLGELFARPPADHLIPALAVLAPDREGGNRAIGVALIDVPVLRGQRQVARALRARSRRGCSFAGCPGGVAAPSREGPVLADAGRRIADHARRRWL